MYEPDNSNNLESLGKGKSYFKYTQYSFIISYQLKNISKLLTFTKNL